MNLRAWYKVLWWEVKSRRLARRSQGWMSQIGLTPPPNPSLVQQYREWCEALENAKRHRANERLMQKCPHLNWDNDDTCVDCGLWAEDDGQCFHEKDEWKDCETHEEGCFKTVCSDCGVTTHLDCDPQTQIIG